MPRNTTFPAVRLPWKGKKIVIFLRHIHLYISVLLFPHFLFSFSYLSFVFSTFPSPFSSSSIPLPHIYVYLLFYYYSHYTHSPFLLLSFIILILSHRILFLHIFLRCFSPLRVSFFPACCFFIISPHSFAFPHPTLYYLLLLLLLLQLLFSISKV
jgi:hypothetical protein